MRHAPLLTDATLARHGMRRADDWTRRDLARCGELVADARTLTRHAERVTCPTCRAMLSAAEIRRAG